MSCLSPPSLVPHVSSKKSLPTNGTNSLPLSLHAHSTLISPSLSIEAKKRKETKREENKEGRKEKKLKLSS
jgi:hypothetical protein